MKPERSLREKLIVLRKSFSINYLVVAIYIIFTVLLTFPAAGRINTHIIGDGDAWKFVWNLWWMKTAIFRGQSPFHTDCIHFPGGDWTFLHTWNYLSTLLAVPLQLIFSLVTIYNLFALATFALAGIGLFRLCRFLGIQPLPAFFAGLAFSFCPYHFSHSLGHWNLIHYHWIPFFVQSFLEGERDGWPRKRILISTVWLVAVGLTDWYYLVFCLLAIPVLAVTGLHRTPSGKQRHLFGAMAVPLAALIILSPLLSGMLWQAANGIPPQNTSGMFSADLQSFVIPGPSSSFSRYFESIQTKWTGNPAEWGSFLPWSVLILTLIGFWFMDRDKKIRWGSWLLVFFVLSLGPYLHIGGKIYSAALLPYGWLEKIPGLAIMQAPGRFHIMTWLGICLLYGFALDMILCRWKKTSIIILLALIGVVESLSIPIQITAEDISPFYRELGKLSDSRAVIDLHYGSRAMFYQTVHEKKIMGSDGMLARQSNSAVTFLRETPVVRDLLIENTITAMRIGMPADFLSAGPPVNNEQLVMVLLGKISGDGELVIRTSRPHELWLDNRCCSDGERDESRISVKYGAGAALLRLRLDFPVMDWTAASTPFLQIEFDGRRIINSADLAQLSGKLQIEPAVKVQGELKTGFLCAFYSIAPSKNEDSDQSITELTRLGFGWIVVPYYGNNHYIRNILRLPSVYQDQWLEAYDLNKR